LALKASSFVCLFVCLLGQFLVGAVENLLLSVVTSIQRNLFSMFNQSGMSESELSLFETKKERKKQKKKKEEEEKRKKKKVNEVIHLIFLLSESNVPLVSAHQ
jgi:hypothetical protein